MKRKGTLREHTEKVSQEQRQQVWIEFGICWFITAIFCWFLEYDFTTGELLVRAFGFYLFCYWFWLETFELGFSDYVHRWLGSDKED